MLLSESILKTSGTLERFWKCTRYAQIQTELFAVKREPDQSLNEFYDAKCSIADTANITAAESEKLVYTAFMHGLCTNRHMHSWVTRCELSGNIESALELAEAYEKEYG